MIINGTFNQQTNDVDVAGNFIIESTGEFIKATDGTLFFDGSTTYTDNTTSIQDVGYVVVQGLLTQATDMETSSAAGS